MCCRFCISAFVDDELDFDSDLSYISCGESLCDDVRILFRSGDRKPVSLLFEGRGDCGWTTIAEFIPRFCPFCGRELLENSK